MASAQTMKINIERTSLTGPIGRLLIVALSMLFSSTAFGVVMETSNSHPCREIKPRSNDLRWRAAEPTGYTIEQPARIALDLSGVQSALSTKNHPLGSGNARSVTVVEAGDRTRVIVSMTELVAYSANVVGNSLYVLVGEDDEGLISTTDVGIAGTTATPTYEEEDFPLVEEIDFRRGEDGEGRVIVRLSEVGIGVDVSSQGGNILVEFANTVIPRPCSVALM